VKPFTEEMLSHDDIYNLVANGPGVFPDFWTEDHIRAVIVAGANLLAERHQQPPDDE
jgi:hypothetical protein